jgi:hypothetical protein
MQGRLGARGVGFRSVFVHSAFVVFVFVCSALVAFISVRSALIVSVAPVTHPASSGSQTWWQVLWWGVRRFVRFVHFRTFGLHCIRYVAFVHVSSPPLTVT